MKVIGQSEILYLRSRVQELEEQLKDINDGMTISYMKGVEDGKDKQAARVKELESLLKEAGNTNF